MEPYMNGQFDEEYYLKTSHTHTYPTKPPVDRVYLELVQKDLYETIKKAEESWDPNVSLAGIAILSKYEKLVDLIQDIKEYGLSGR